MRGLIASTLIAALTLTGCGLIRPRVMARSQPGAPAESVSALRAAARRIPVGEDVKIVTLSGEVITGELRAADESRVMIEKAGEPFHDSPDHHLRTAKVTVPVAYDTMQSIESGMSPRGKIISWSAIAAGVIVGVIVSSEACCE